MITPPEPAEPIVLTFVIPLMSRTLAKRWDVICRHAETTVASALGQTEPRVRVVMTGHERPEFSREFGERFEFLSLDEPPPPATRPDGMSPHDYHRLRERDKWLKLARGLMTLRQHPSQFVMFTDGDDMVHRQTAAFCAAHPEANGWYAEQGWEYFSRPGILHLRRHDFHQHCGTSAILATRHVHLPSDFSESERQASVILRAGHTIIVEEMKRLGTPLEPLPFPLTIYRRMTGENQSNVLVGVTRQLRDAFQGYKGLLRALPSFRTPGRRLIDDYGFRR